MTRQNHLGLLAVGLSLLLCTSSQAGWGSSFGSGGSFGSSFGSRSSFGSHGGFASKLLSHKSNFGSTGSASFGSGGGSTGSFARSFGSWGGGSNGGGSAGASGLFHGGLIDKLRTHHQRKMSWLRSLRPTSGGSGGSSGGSWGGSTGSSSHGGWTRSFAASNGSSGGSTGTVSSAVSFSSPVVSHGSSGGSSGGSTGSFSSVSYAPAFESSPIVESTPVESYSGESYPVESYPVESYATESYVGDAYTVDPYATGGYTVDPYASEGTVVEGFSEGQVVEGVDPYADSGYSTPSSAVPTEGNVPTESMDPSSTEPADIAPAIDPNALDPTSNPTPTPAEPQEALLPLGDGDSAKSTRADARMVVSLPNNATLYVNGMKTTSEGAARQFISRDLEKGLRYPYDLKAVLEIDGRQIVKTKQVVLQAGDHSEVAFGFADPIETKLTLRVPEDADLTIAGADTSSTGSERKFTTLRLSPGQTWSDYEVVVTVNRNGRKVSKSQTIDLQAGENRTLTFDFDVDAVASLK